MKNFITMLNRSTIHLAVVALLTLLFAGCAVVPKAENVSMATTAANMRADFPDDLQPNPNDSPGFTPWGGGADD
ncbi:MAG TPA: hypothetical protein VGF37_09780 [Chthoniobacterales bacterium]